MRKLTQLAEGLNAYTLSFDDGSLDELRSLYERGVRDYIGRRTKYLLRGEKYVQAEWGKGKHQFFTCSYGSSPLLWVSPNDAATFGIFRKFFDSLDIADDIRRLIDLEHRVIVYSGFFVVGNQMPEETWHVDYLDGANAFTLITPLFELDEAHGNLLYRDAGSATRRYPYRCGEAIIVGDGFSHTTEPYRGASSIRTLLSVTFGTDKLEHWNILEKTAGGQCKFLILPCGHQRGTCHCMRDFAAARDLELRERIARALGTRSVRIVVSPDLTYSESDGESALLDAAGRRCASLNPAGAHLWRLIERLGDLQSVRAAILAERDATPAEVDHELLEFVRSLARQGAVTLEESRVDI